MKERWRRYLWRVVVILGNSAGLGYYVPPPGVFDRVDPPPVPRVDPNELDEWLASVLGADPADRDRGTERDHG